MTLREILYAEHLAADPPSASYKADRDDLETFHFNTAAEKVAFLTGRLHWNIPQAVAALVDCGEMTVDNAMLYLAQVGFDPERDLRIARGGG